MNTTITAKKTTVRDSFKERIDKKLSKFDRFFDDTAAANVVVRTEGGRETVEVTINNRGMIYRAEKTTADRADSLDAVTDVLFKQIVKNKSKLSSRMKTASFEDIEEPIEEETIAEPIKVKKFEITSMEVEEAILQMNMLDHAFYLFRNADTGEMNVVYRRHGNSYGLIEPIE